MYSPSGHPRCKFIFSLSEQILRDSITSLVHRWILCSEWVSIKISIKKHIFQARPASALCAVLSVHLRTLLSAKIQVLYPWFSSENSLCLNQERNCQINREIDHSLFTSKNSPWVHFPKASLANYGRWFRWTLLVMTELVAIVAFGKRTPEQFCWWILMWKDNSGWTISLQKSLLWIMDTDPNLQKW